jgi:hypothetical protein
MRLNVFGVIALSLFAIIPAGRAGTVAYAIDAGGNFGTIDLTNGVFTDIGNISPRLEGMGDASGTLYGAPLLTQTLVSINPANAQTTTVGGPAGFNYGDLGSTTAGLYGLDYSNNLYSINPVTGIPTLIGPLGVPAASGGLSADGASLYLADGPNLYSVNTSTAQLTLIGDMGLEIGAMVVSGGILYGASLNCPCSLDTLNTSTGQATFVANITGAPFGLYGLASPQTSSTPEPSTSVLLVAALAALMACLRRRKPSAYLR